MRARRPAPKPELAAEFRRRMALLKLTARQVAERIGVVDATLRTWLARNRFPMTAAEDLARVLAWDVPAEHLLRHFRVDGGRWARGGVRPAERPLTCDDLFAQFDRKARRANRLLKRTADCLPPLLDAMGENDLLVVATATVTPPEMEAHPPEPLVDGIARAVGRGGRFLYLRPSDPYLSDFRRRYDHALPYRPAEFDTEVERLRSAVAERLPADSGDAAARVAQVRTPEGANEFLVPGFRIGMLQSFLPSHRPTVRMLVWLPSGADAPHYLPATSNDHFVTRFGRFAHTAVLSATTDAAADRSGLAAILSLLEVKEPGPRV